MQPQTSNLAAAQSSCTGRVAEAIGKHIVNLNSLSSVKVWGSYGLGTQSRSELRHQDPFAFTPANTSSSVPHRVSHHTGVQSGTQCSNAKSFVLTTVGRMHKTYINKLHFVIAHPLCRGYFLSLNAIAFRFLSSLTFFDLLITPSFKIKMSLGTQY